MNFILRPLRQSATTHDDTLLRKSVIKCFCLSLFLLFTQIQFYDMLFDQSRWLHDSLYHTAELSWAFIDAYYIFFDDATLKCAHDARRPDGCCRHTLS